MIDSKKVPESPFPPLITLLRSSQQSYAFPVKEALSKVHCSDIPKNGIYVIAGVALNGTSLEGLIKQLGVSKQAAGQLADTLALRGYINRSPNPVDRRRMDVNLTERGLLAAQAFRQAVESVENELVAIVGADYLKHTKKTLTALIER